MNGFQFEVIALNAVASAHLMIGNVCIVDIALAGRTNIRRGCTVAAKRIGLGSGCSLEALGAVDVIAVRMGN